MGALEIVRQKYRSLAGVMDERTRRIWAGTEAVGLGHGGITLVATATGLTRMTVTRGMAELKRSQASGVPLRPLSRPLDERIRRPGGGRKRWIEVDPKLLRDLRRLVDPVTRGDPQSPLRWTSKSCGHLTDELKREGHKASASTVRRLLEDLQFNLHANRKTEEGKEDHPDRDAQFQHINSQVVAFQKRHQPVISVDAKKTEKMGNLKNAGREWGPKGHVERVNVYDFLNKKLGKAIPYGVYDIHENKGWVNVGTDHNTPQFAVESIRRWWEKMGRPAYPTAKHLLITADSGSSNGYKATIWKTGLQALANETGLTIAVSHFPPGTSKWNKIEHRMFSQITMNWRGRPLESHEVIVQLIGNTTTKTGLKIRAELDTGKYPTGLTATDKALDELLIKVAKFHGEWNYQIRPNASPVQELHASATLSTI